MPKKIPELLDFFLKDCLLWDESFTFKPLFWWFWIYKFWKMFAIFGFWTIYFKVWENNIKYFEKLNSKKFSCEMKWKSFSMDYYELPAEIFENREKLNLFIEKSLEVKSKTKPKKKSKKDLEIINKVLESLLKIPKWKITTYKILADKFWVHSRKIASIMRYNKFPEIFPCYKVISHSWKISGYSALDWVNSKINLLQNDWIKIENWKILEKYYFYF